MIHARLAKPGVSGFLLSKEKPITIRTDITKNAHIGLILLGHPKIKSLSHRFTIVNLLSLPHHDSRPPSRFFFFPVNPLLISSVLTFPADISCFEHKRNVSVVIYDVNSSGL